MKAQVSCKICEQFFDFDNVHYIGNWDYEYSKDYPVNLCDRCFNYIVEISKGKEIKNTVYCNECQESFTEDKVIWIDDSQSVYPVCKSCQDQIDKENRFNDDLKKEQEELLKRRPFN